MNTLDRAAHYLAATIAATAAHAELQDLNDALRTLYRECLAKGATEPAPVPPGSLEFAVHMAVDAVGAASDALGPALVQGTVRSAAECARVRLLMTSLRAAAVEGRC